ncbi:unnamed protein product [Bursaphelenchus xylophilus]|uniref:non-specific serine/threonine protein kinase n=1 Tax=Bursaphelenchus xylophilus TaxID=6326 RepID=A0A1I7RVF0_BURXY|nr:unnamed protein product [Bursaphelenchus xylophilus]CAG9086752.1 unnamed protein product [Bursaphelenchus xylophilus]
MPSLSPTTQERLDRIKKAGTAEKPAKVSTKQQHTSSQTKKNEVRVHYDQAPLSEIPKGTVIKTNTDAYKVTGKVGGGGFGDVYVAVRASTKALCAIKAECTGNLEEPRLEREYYVYLAIEKGNRAGKALPNLVGAYGFANMNNKLKFIFMPLLGPSLESTIKRNRPTRSTCYKAAIQMCRSVQSLHKLGYIHRDIKPANFVFESRTSYSTLVLIDFGMATHYPTKVSEIPETSLYDFIGTLKYAPRTTHRGEPQSRKDDLESWVYVAMEVFDFDALPWNSCQEQERVHKMKKDFFRRRALRDTVRVFVEVLGMIEAIELCADPPYSQIMAHLGAMALTDGCRIDGDLQFAKRETPLTDIRRAKQLDSEAREPAGCDSEATPYQLSSTKEVEGKVQQLTI